MRFWFENARTLNAKGRDFSENLDFESVLFCDASYEGYGGFLDSTESVIDVSRSSGMRSVSSDAQMVYALCAPEVAKFCAEYVASSDASDVARKSCAPYVASCDASDVARSCSSDIVHSRAPDVARLIAPDSASLDCRKAAKSGAPEVAISDTAEVVRSRAPEAANHCSPDVVKPGARDEVIFDDTNRHHKGEVIGVWNVQERVKSSTWRETEAVRRVLLSNVNQLRGKNVKVFSDNKNVQFVLEAGSTKEDLQIIATEVNSFCVENQISLSVGWIPRSLNEKADHLSRCKDSDDWEISDYVFKELDIRWGPHTVDRFACTYNSKCIRFNTRWWMPGTEGINAFSQRWSEPENNWLVPPPRLVLLTLQKMQTDKAKGTLIIPSWPSAPFYPVLMNGAFKRSV